VSIHDLSTPVDGTVARLRDHAGVRTRSKCQVVKGAATVKQRRSRRQECAGDHSCEPWSTLCQSTWAVASNGTRSGRVAIADHKLDGGNAQGRRRWSVPVKVAGYLWLCELERKESLMARLTRRAVALLGCLLIFAVLTACGSGSDPKPTESTASASAATTEAAAAPGDSLLPEGTYRTPELTRKQLIATAVKAGFTPTQAEQSLARERINQTATFTLTLEHGQWSQSFNYDRVREGLGFEATYKVIDDSTVVVTEPEGDETVFKYAVVGDAIRIRFKNVDPKQLCQHDPKCAGGVIVWQSAPFSRV
jgi:hypothetical protein